MTTHEIALHAMDIIEGTPRQRILRTDLMGLVMRLIYQGGTPSSSDMLSVRGVINKMHHYYPSMIGIKQISARRYELYRL